MKSKIVFGLLGVFLLAIIMAPVSAVMIIDSAPTLIVNGEEMGALDSTTALNVPACSSEVSFSIPMTNLETNPTNEIDISVEVIYGGKTRVFTETFAVPITSSQLDFVTGTMVVDFSEVSPSVGASATMKTRIYGPEHLVYLDHVVGGYSTPITFTTCAGIPTELNKVLTDVEHKTELNPGDDLRLEIDLANPSNEFDLENIEITGWVEDNSGKRVTNKETVTRVRIRDGGEAMVSLNINLPADLKDSTYDILLELTAEYKDSDKTEVSETWVGDLELTKNDNAVLVKTIEFTDSNVAPGAELKGKVELVNTGINDQHYLTLVARVPELELEYITPLLSDIKEDETKYAYFNLVIPTDAEAGLYFVEVEVSNAKVSGSERALFSITGVAEQSATTPGAGLTIVPAGTTIDAPIGKGGVYTLNIGNTGTTSKTISLDASGFENWAGLRIDPQTFVLGSGETRMVRVYLSPNRNADQGTNSFTVYVNSNGVSVAHQTLNANVVGTTFGPIENTLRWIFGAIVVILIITLIVWVIKGGNDYRGSKPTAEIEQIYY